jgi:hypothetical protein
MRDTNPFISASPEKVWIITRVSQTDPWGGPTTSTFITESRFRKAIEKYGDQIMHIQEITCTYKELNIDGTPKG